MDRQTDLRQRTYKEAKAEIQYDLQKLKRTETETETITGFRDDESSLRYSSSKNESKNTTFHGSDDTTDINLTFYKKSE